MKPYCLNNQRLFNSKCLLDCHVKNERLEVVTIMQGQCPGNQEARDDQDDKCKQTCTYSDDDVPICADDGVMYPNECAFDLAVCSNSDLRILGDERCEEMESDNESNDNNESNDGDDYDINPCGMVCNKMYKPVCGTDQKTYSNKCMMDLAACEQDKWIDVMNWEACETDKLMHTGNHVPSLSEIIN